MKKMKKLVLFNLMVLFTSCKYFEKKELITNQTESKTEIINTKKNSKISKSDIYYSEELTNEVDNLVSKLGNFWTTEDYIKIHKTIEDSISIYRSTLIFDLKKVKKGSVEFDNARAMIEMLKLDNLQFKEFAANRVNMIDNSFGLASYSPTDSRYQNTNRYYIYLIWKHYLFLKAIGEDSRDNLIPERP